jgi:hypothetical protein
VKIKTKAYLPFELNEEYNKIVASDELFLKDNEIICFSKDKPNYTSYGLAGVKRQVYTIKYLDEYHTEIKQPENYVAISFKKNNEDFTVYIEANTIRKFMLKWMNKETLLQKDGNFKWIAGIIVTLFVACLGWRLSWVLAHMK